MGYKVLDVKAFEKDLLKIARKHPVVIDLVESLFADLEEGKFRGDRIPRLKGNVVYKTRLSNPNANKGKSGGFRVIWYLVTSDSEIYPLTIYSKNDQEDISVKEITRIIDRIFEDDEIYFYGDLVRETDSNQFPEGSELAMTLADQWREEGLQKGIEKGKQIGKEEALAEVAANQLTERFGKLPLDIKEAIMQADLIALGLLLSNIFRYEAVEDVWKYIQ